MINGINPSTRSHASGAGPTGPIKAMALQVAQELRELPPTLAGAADPSHNGSLVTNANGAPQLGSISINFSPDDLAATLIVLQSKTQEAQLTTAKEGLITSNKKLEDQKQRTLDKIKDWADKCKAAEAKAKVGGIVEWFKKSFTAIAAVFAVVAASIATVSTGFAALPLLLLALAAVVPTLTSLASDIDKARGGKGFDHLLKWTDPSSALGNGIANLFKLIGVNEEAAAIIAVSVTIATTLAILVAAVMLTGNAGAAVDGVSKTILVASRVGQAVAGVAGGLTQAAKGGLDIAVAHYQRDAAVIQSDRKKIDAIIAKLQQQMEEGREDIKKVLDEIMEGMNIVSQMISASNASRSQITSNLTGKGQTI